MHEVTEGLRGVEVVVDDFVVVGFGESVEDATADHDNNLEAFLGHCTVKHLKLNDKRTSTAITGDNLIVHVATSEEGSPVDAYKVQAIMEMPPPLMWQQYSIYLT